jgi:predicted ester cyclase
MTTNITSDTETNKAIVRRLGEAANTRDLRVISAVIDEVVDRDVRNTTPLPVEATGAEALKQVWAMLLRVFPDLQLSVEELVAEGDTVVSRHTVRGTQRGEYMGLAGTGRPVSYGEMFIFRFENSRIAEISGIVDVAGQMRQLGLLPAL